MPKVVNEIVKQEWEKDYWIESKSQGYFYFGGQMYKSSKYGDIMVGFNHSCAFVMSFNTDGVDGVKDGTDLYTFKNYKLELKALSAEERFYVFPTDFDNTILLSEPDTDELKVDTIKELGLEEYIDDIQNRLYDVLQYNADYAGE